MSPMHRAHKFIVHIVRLNFGNLEGSCATKCMVVTGVARILCISLPSKTNSHKYIGVPELR